MLGKCHGNQIRIHLLGTNIINCRVHVNKAPSQILLVYHIFFFFLKGTFDLMVVRDKNSASPVSCKTVQCLIGPQCLTDAWPKQPTNTCILLPAGSGTKTKMNVGLHHTKKRKMLNSKEELERKTEKEQIKESWDFTDRVVSKTPYFYRRM